MLSDKPTLVLESKRLSLPQTLIKSMLVRLHDQFPRASPHRRSESNMALIPVKFDYRSQIIDNCEFFIAKYDIVSVITTKDAIGDYKAYAIRSNEESRDVLLSSDPCNAAWRAIESLHTKSCEAAHQYITTNGFSYPPDLKKSGLGSEDEKDEDNDDEDDDAASVVSGRSASSTVALSYWGSSDDEATMTPASSAGPHASRRETNRNEKGNNIGKRRSKPPAGTKQAREFSSRFPIVGPDDSDDDEHAPQQLPSRVRVVSPMRSSPASNTSYRPPPPPPQGWTGAPIPPPPVRGFNVSAPPPLPPQSQPGPQYCQQPPPAQLMPPPPPAPVVSVAPVAHAAPASVTPGPAGPMGIRPSSLHYKASAPNLNPSNMTTSPPHHPNPNTHPPAPRLYDVRLTIRWLGHGEQRILESSRASIRALQEMAVGYVRTHAAAFDKTGSASAMAEVRWGLRACVRRAFFGPGEAYDMSAYRGDDLTKLFNVLSAGNIPRFEVEVETVVPQQHQHQHQQVLD
ncbi:hypothetical protein F5Y13DRAFT_62422 [Hypoxylon sp. FL1857]|nr:hypothetical protein F5Y13DRAFT_62422 [Hypoxylon sp. FL1857]